MKCLQEHERCNAIARGQRIVQASALSLLDVTHALPAYYGTNVTYDCHYVQTDIAHSLCLSLSASPTISQVIATIITTTLYCEEKHRPRQTIMQPECTYCNERPGVNKLSLFHLNMLQTKTLNIFLVIYCYIILKKPSSYNNQPTSSLCRCTHQPHSALTTERLWSYRLAQIC